MNVQTNLHTDFPRYFSTAFVILGTGGLLDRPCVGLWIWKVVQVRERPMSLHSLTVDQGRIGLVVSTRLDCLNVSLAYGTRKLSRYGLGIHASQAVRFALRIAHKSLSF